MFLLLNIRHDYHFKLFLNSMINAYITYIVSADSPLGISLRSPLLVRSPPTSCSSSREESSWDSFQPLLPEVCLSQIWQETQIAVRYTKLLITLAEGFHYESLYVL